MKKFLLIGCSNGLDLHRQFGHVFGDTNITYINLSFTGMGNRYITARLFEYIDDIGCLIMYICNTQDYRE